MRNSLQKQHVTRHVAAESFGRIARRTASATLVQLAAGRHSANEANITSHDECEATAWRALAAGGIGRVGVPRNSGSHHPSATEVKAAARIERARRVSNFAAKAWRAVTNRLQRWLVRARQRRQARATYLALRNLDARTLRDIGFDRSEILSVAAEVAGIADSNRAHPVLVLHSRPR